MRNDQLEGLESGLSPHHSQPVKISVLRRITSAISRVLGPRSQATAKCTPAEPDTSRAKKANYSKAENDEACAKIWSIYVGEAERYDAALVESWRADMDGMLIFV
ncbi:hypothetical protein B0H11DRAFT_1824621, partial [Mycena galericulata]